MLYQLTCGVSRENAVVEGAVLSEVGVHGRQSDECGAHWNVLWSGQLIRVLHQLRCIVIIIQHCY